MLVCFVFICRSWNVDSSAVKDYERIIAIAQKEVGVKELTGNNDGERVEEYLRAVGLKKGQPYCSAFVSWVFEQAGYRAPRTGWSPALFPGSRIVKDAKPAAVFGIYFSSLKRIAHVGLVESVRSDWITCLEANTNIAGSREGEGVFRRIRHKRTISRFADWIKQNN